MCLLFSQTKTQLVFWVGTNSDANARGYLPLPIKIKVVTYKCEPTCCDISILNQLDNF